MAVLELWRADLAIPFSYSNDADYYLMLTKGVVAHGWPYVNHDLGVPFGQQLYDFAIGGDDLDLLILKLLGLGSHNPFVVTNLFYLASFPLSALSAFAVMRALGISRATSAACAVLYALAPYHFVRGETHLYLSMDFMVPLGAYLVVAIWSGTPLFRRRARGRGPLALASTRSLLTVAICAVLASSAELYYAGFVLVLALVAGLVRGAARLEARSLWTGAGVAVAIAAFAAANLAPTLAYASRHGRNPVVAERLPQEADAGGLKLAQLLAPVPGHRIEALARLGASYAWSQHPETFGTIEQPALGTVAAAGFVWLLGVLAMAVVGTERHTRESIEDLASAVPADARRLLVTPREAILVVETARL